MNIQTKRKNCARVGKEVVIASLVVETDAPKVAGVATLASGTQIVTSAIPANSVVTGVFMVHKNLNAPSGLIIQVSQSDIAEFLAPAGATGIQGEPSVLVYVEDTTDIVLTIAEELTSGSIEVFIEFYELSATNGMRVQPTNLSTAELVAEEV